ncbi:ribosomal protein S18-alanine N-acetyltransferase [Clostridium chauvoei]|uniref:[Ribosomal protein bS18]-alanine N-acetyltransferase n=2 Tax=Clostridium chauvoei TaxID=46867 RepID=A0A1U6JPY8_9CLOT|nr:ribosomal protein S18-alanine N-acetyltransferase [Clostridium chauvoei]ATD55898.1 ribosomal-protein-alanine N-acetyltransferase [Clostridium chauvoei]ATD56430.1 ribosomal-protein-alanine N-acetyltransferase [Clostridium chauvoei]MBX7281131.1 ribosomal protein S18-alanine N-acetyltransferase [Clostridium chauvoei]MBX7283613.1 ribosomal protein S18-alanine N-acetyltransferase [Clostridium chauvoei]MBX7286221.1 ribosomal protein S18-alanine N-acetyltransferase [Clostridium chauvoei]
MKIAYNLMTSNDIDGVYEISNLCFSVPWSIESIKSELNNPLAKYIVAKEIASNRIIGFVGVWIIAGEGDITNIGVHPNYRKNHIATNLLQCLFKLCEDLNCNTINLEVRESNIPAQNLYTNFEFKNIGLRKGYYEDNKENAVLMQYNKF